jgi:hypothetical protein
MAFRANHFILFFFLATNLRAQSSSVDLALRTVLTDINRIESFVSQAADCYQSQELEEYQENFCRNHEPYLYSFQSISAQLQRDKDNNFLKWQGYLNGAVAPDYAKPILKVINDGYEACVEEENRRLKEAESSEEYFDETQADIYFTDGPNDLWDEELYEEEQEPVASSVIDLFLPRNYNGNISLNPDFFNQRLSSIEAYGSMLNDPESRELIASTTRRASDLRARILLQNPLLLRYMFADMPHLNQSVDVFWAQIQSKTGIDPALIPSDVRSDYERVRHFRSVLNDLLNNQGFVLPSDGDHVVSQETTDFGHLPQLTRNSAGEIDFEFNPEVRPTIVPRVLNDEILLQALGASREDLIRSFYTNERYSMPLDENNLDMAEINSIFEQYATEIRELDRLETQIRDRYRAAVESNFEAEGLGDPPDDYQEENFCESSRQLELRDVSDRDYVIDFYQNPTNREFIQNQFTMAQDIMAETINRLGLSRGSTLGVQRLLSDVTFDYPDQLTHESHSQYYQDLDQGLHWFGLVYPSFSRFEGRDRTQEFLANEGRYNELNNIFDYDGVNGSYMPNSAYRDGNHFIRTGCGLAHPSIQENNPELLLGVIAHELGHALDPNLSITNREFYSPGSLQQVADLRSCLISNNNGRYSSVDEDFADHLESHFYATLTSQSQGQPDWSLRRLRFLHHAYSALCEDRRDSFLDTHSSDRYRYAHVISHPDLRSEYGEYALPSVPFCPQLVSPTRGGQER